MKLARSMAAKVSAVRQAAPNAVGNRALKEQAMQLTAASHQSSLLEFRV